MNLYFKSTEYTVKDLIRFTNREEVFVGNPSGWDEETSGFKSYSVAGDILVHDEMNATAIIGPELMDMPVKRLVSSGPYEGISVWCFEKEVVLDWVVESTPDPEECEMPFGKLGHE